MRTLLIFVLSLALVAAAFFTRPSKREFILYLLDRQASDGEWNHHAIERAESVAKSVTIKNRILWTDIEKDGKVLYTGAFAHWVARGQDIEKSLPALKDLARLLAKQ